MWVFLGLPEKQGSRSVGVIGVIGQTFGGIEENQRKVVPSLSLMFSPGRELAGTRRSEVCGAPRKGPSSSQVRTIDQAASGFALSAAVCRGEQKTVLKACGFGVW